VSHKDNELEDHDKDNVSIRISDEVIASIAGVAAAQVEGVAAMSGNLMSDIGDVFLGKKKRWEGSQSCFRSGGSRA